MAKEKAKRSRLPIVIIGLIVLLIAAVAGLRYWETLQSRVYVEKSLVSAPIINLAPATAGTIERVFVHEGEHVRKNQIVAIVSNQSLYAQTEGLVVAVKDAPGEIASTQSPVVQMIQPEQSRIVGQLEENKGLKDVQPGQRVMFTVDAFEPKQYEGIVESVSPTSRESDIVFSISDKREAKVFDIKVKYDINAYPELRNGMSAKMWIYK